MYSRRRTCAGRKHRPRWDKPDRRQFRGRASASDGWIVAVAADSPWPPPAIRGHPAPASAAEPVIRYWQQPELRGASARPPLVPPAGPVSGRLPPPAALLHLRGPTSPLGQQADLMSTGEAARLLGCSRQHVVDLCVRGVLPFVSVGSHRRVRRTDVTGLMNRELTQGSEAVLVAAPRRRRAPCPGPGRRAGPGQQKPSAPQAGPSPRHDSAVAGRVAESP